MKLLILFLSINLYAMTPVGGTLSSGSNELTFSCSKDSIDQGCGQIDVYRKTYHSPDFEKIKTINASNIKAMTKLSKKYARKSLSRQYYYLSLVTWYETESFVDVYIEYPTVGLPLLLAAGVIDIAKSPIVGGAYAANMAIDIIKRRKIVRAFKHLLNDDQVGNTKEIRNRYFSAIINGIKNLKK